MKSVGVCSRTTARAARDSYICNASSKKQQGPQRRQMLAITGATFLASQLAEKKPALAGESILPVDKLSIFQRSDQKQQYQLRAAKILSKYVNADDASSCMRILLNEGMTYDRQSGKGGVDGSIFLSSAELSLPQNKGLDSLISKLKQAKKEIDEQSAKYNAGDISYADLEVIAAKVAVQDAWLNEKIKKAKSREDGILIATAFGSPFDIRLGRIDSSEAVSKTDFPVTGDDVDKITTFLAALNNPNPGQKGNLLTPKPPFWEKPAFLVWCSMAENPTAEEERLAAASSVYKGLKKDYDQSRASISRSSYEVDFVEVFNKLANLGAKYNPDAYLYEVVLQVPDRL